MFDSEVDDFKETYDYISNNIGIDVNIHKKEEVLTPKSYYEKNTRNINQITGIDINNNGKEKSDMVVNIKAKSTINKNVLYGLPHEAFIKVDLTHINNEVLKSEGEFCVYDTYIHINNPEYELKIPYYMLHNIELKTMFGVVLIIRLNTGSFIYINPIGNDKDKMQQIYKVIQYYINNPPITNTIQQVPYNNNQFIQQQYQQSNYHQPTYNQAPINKKSLLVAVILHILLIGLGYAYMNKWGKFLVVLLISLVCLATIMFFIPAIILIILWIYVLLDTISMVGKYNNGQSY